MELALDVDGAVPLLEVGVKVTDGPVADIDAAEVG